MIVFDVETQYLSHEVGGWGNIEALRLSVACTFDERRGYQSWWEAQAADLVEELRKADLIVGFNVNAFDFRVLAGYGDTQGFEDRTFDIHDEIFQQVHLRLGLNTLAVLNLGEAKMAESGTHAVRLWRTGRLEELEAYCRLDVELTKRLYEHWEAQGVLWVSQNNYVIWPGVRPTAMVDEDEED